MGRNGCFSVILKKNTIKTPEVIFHVRLCALWLSLLPILKKCLYASFSFSYCFRRYSCAFNCHFFFCFHPRARSFFSQLKRAVEPRKIFIMPGHYKKIIPSQQPIRAHILLQPYNNIIIDKLPENEIFKQ